MIIGQPSLPPVNEYAQFLKEIWDSNILTNCGPIHNRLEAELSDALQILDICLYNNCTSALTACLMTLQSTGDVITTPFTFPATVTAILNAGFRPVFADIDPSNLCLCPDSVSKLIDDNTKAILPVHVYGQPADVSAFEKLGEQYGLKVIYDAAHAFGVRYGGQSLLSYGDFACTSFHATKVFNTVEGGGVVAKNPQDLQKLRELRNFGMIDKLSLGATGINGKMSELHAAMGILNLRYYDNDLSKRKRLHEIYIRSLSNINSLRMLLSKLPEQFNYGYFPVQIMDSKISVDQFINALTESGIYARRYFYPCLSEMEIFSPYLRSELSVACNVANSVVCLPITPNMSDVDAHFVSEEIISFFS